jgi:hypothetical protein
MIIDDRLCMTRISLLPVIPPGLRRHPSIGIDFMIQDRIRLQGSFEGDFDSIRLVLWQYSCYGDI